MECSVLREPGEYWGAAESGGVRGDGDEPAEDMAWEGHCCG